ncbi:hypothetical protein CJF12_08475 [Chryseobacterium piperi]|uniref:RNA recognition motif domain-containing protein n=1 Tax=Chryseobacterium piperi TaxID=558152 RepID=UPI0009FBB1F4|nr:RNA-binding protein [Chryseobacterium piperi]ASW74324.1 hypothetical protein CJF12_08475 [Chryseobacterium piperi]
MNIYIGNFNLQTKEKQLESSFTPLGDLLTVEIIKEDHSESSRDDGFVKMPN